MAIVVSVIERCWLLSILGLTNLVNNGDITSCPDKVKFGPHRVVLNSESGSDARSAVDSTPHKCLVGDIILIVAMMSHVGMIPYNFCMEHR